MRIPQLNFYVDASSLDRISSVRTNSRKSFSQHERSVGLSIAILNLNKPGFIIPLCEQLKEVKAHFEKKGVGFEILIGDTGSDDASVLEYFSNNEHVIRVMRGLRYNFSSCNNLLFNSSRFSCILFLNNDIRFDDNPSEIIIEMFEMMKSQTPLSILGSYLFFGTGELQHGGVDFFKNEQLRGFCYHPNAGKKVTFVRDDASVEVPAVTGAFLMMKSDVFILCGGFDEAYQAECQDVDLCLKNARLGYKTGIVSLGRVTHFENGTRAKKEENWSDRRLFMRKWASFIEAVFL